MNESCRSSHKELRTVEFAFFQFFYEFISILQVCCFLKQKKKKTKLCSWAPGKNWGLADMPLAGARNRGGGDRPDFGESGRRRRGGTGGGARGRREQPAGGLGQGWGRSEKAAPQSSGSGGGDARRRRRSGKGERWWPGLGGSRGHGEVVCGVFWARGRAEEGSPRRGGIWRRQWRATAVASGVAGEVVGRVAA